MHFVDEADAINKYVGVLQHQGVHAFVAIIHEGGSQSAFAVGTVNDRIQDIASRLDPAVSVLVSGHSHTVIDTRVGHTLVVQAGAFTEAFDDVHLLLDRNRGTITATWASIQPTWRSTPPSTTDPTAPAVTPDPDVQAVVDAAVQATNPITQQVITTPRRPSPHSARAGRRPPASHQQETSSPTRSVSRPGPSWPS